MPRFSANLTMLFGELPFLDRVAAAARAGFRAVEFVSPYEHDRERLVASVAERGLEVSVFNLPAGDWAAGDRGLACHPARTAEFRAGIPLALEWARALRTPRLHAMAGLRPPRVAEAELRRTWVENVRFAARALAAEGRDLLVEAINDRDMPGYYVTTSRQALDLIDEVGEPNVFFQLDAYHLHVMGEDVAATVERHLPRIRHVQVADAPGRHEPGTGEIDFPALLSLLDRLGYAGWVGCEYRPLAGTEAGLGWMDRYR